MQNTNFNAVQQYLKSLVTASTFLNDFTGIFSRDFFTKKDSFAGLTSPMLIMFQYELGHESSGQNVLAVRKIGFSIMFNNVAPDDIPAQYEAISQAEILANKVLARIRHDSNDRDHVFYNSYLPETVQILPVELNADNFGVDVFFSLKNAQNMKVELTDWSDITSLC